jgi:hypothetical protein
VAVTIGKTWLLLAIAVIMQRLINHLKNWVGDLDHCRANQSVPLGEFWELAEPKIVGCHISNHLVRLQLLLESITLKPMRISFIQAATNFKMAQEDGAMPGESLSAAQTALYFVGAPVAIFLLISVIVYALTGERKEKTESKDSVLTHIE